MLPFMTAYRKPNFEGYHPKTTENDSELYYLSKIYDKPRRQTGYQPQNGAKIAKYLIAFCVSG